MDYNDFAIDFKDSRRNDGLTGFDAFNAEIEFEMAGRWRFGSELEFGTEPKAKLSPVSQPEPSPVSRSGVDVMMPPIVRPAISSREEALVPESRLVRECVSASPLTPVLKGADTNKSPDLEIANDADNVKTMSSAIRLNASILVSGSASLDYESVCSYIRSGLRPLNDWLERLIKSGKSLPTPFRQSDSDPVVEASSDELREHPNIWFLGDIHGDFLALQSALITVYQITREQNLPKPVFVLLGDVFDRLKYSFETLFTVLDLISHGEQIVWLAGNHDQIVFNSECDLPFTASTLPSEFCQWLNTPPENNPWAHDMAAVRTMVKRFSQLVPYFPVAAYFAPGLLAAHGGVPHSDVQPLIKTWEDLRIPEAQSDFIWIRLSNLKKKIPNRTSRSCQMGVNDFNSFMKQMALMGRPVCRFLRGHDHFPERFVPLPKYQPVSVHTINTVCCTADGAVGGSSFYTRPAIVAYNAAQKTLQPYLIQIEPEVVDRWHQQDCNC